MTIVVFAWRLNPDRRVTLRVLMLRDGRARRYDAQPNHLQVLRRAAAQKRIRLYSL